LKTSNEPEEVCSSNGFDGFGAIEYSESAIEITSRLSNSSTTSSNLVSSTS